MELIQESDDSYAIRISLLDLALNNKLRINLLNVDE